LFARYKGRYLGTFGALATQSFHETKNFSCGEGGALLVNDPELVERAEILWEKGTDRAKFFRGEVQRYHWVDLGSSYLMSDLNAAYLWPQLRRTEEITRTRRATWEAYHEALAPLEHAGLLRRPVVPEGAEGNGHLYHVLFPGLDARTRALEHLASRGVHAVFHYVPLHSSPAGLRYGRAAGELPVTDAVSDRIVRLPFYNGMGAAEVRRVADALRSLPA
jgi:dTDP-4-amino-4,6-dideoxygalactose transaminase